MAEKILESLEIKTGENTSDKYIIPYNALANRPDLSVYAKLAGNNTFTGGQTITGANGGYSINASGYIKGSWLQASVPTNKGSNTGKVCVFDGAGWIYYRTPAEILSEAGGAKASDIPDVSGKANLNGGNTFSGAQTFKDFIEFVDSNGDGVLSLGNNAIFVDPEGRGLIPVSFSGDFGLSGQVLTSQGSNTTPIWEYVTKHGYTELTNEWIYKIKEPGWYRAAANNSCNDKPSPIGNSQFLLLVEQLSDGTIKQTCYRLDANVHEQMSTAYIRYINPTGGASGWYPMTLVHNASQTFSGRKTFSSGINLTNSLQVNGSSGTAGQVLTSTGTGAPQWKTPSGGSGAKTYSDYIYADDVTTIFGNNEYGNAFIFAASDSGQGIRQIYSIYVGGVKTDILTTDPASDYVDQAVCINISRISGNTPYSFINVNVFYKNTLKTIHIDDISNSTIDLRYTDSESQTSSLYLNITKGTT